MNVKLVCDPIVTDGIGIYISTLGIQYLVYTCFVRATYEPIDRCRGPIILVVTVSRAKPLFATY